MDRRAREQPAEERSSATSTFWGKVNSPVEGTLRTPRSRRRNLSSQTRRPRDTHRGTRSVGGLPGVERQGALGECRQAPARTTGLQGCQVEHDAVGGELVDALAGRHVPDEYLGAAAPLDVSVHPTAAAARGDVVPEAAD